MIVELTNNNVEMSALYEVERIDENRYGGILHFQFYYGNRRWSREYREPTYTYRVIDDRR